MFTLQLAKQFSRSIMPLATLASSKPLGGNTAVRFVASRVGKDCTPPPPRCGAEMIKKLVADGCRKAVKKAEFKNDPPPFKSMWENPECCKLPCPDAVVRFDELYYRPSDKSKKVYRQTWIECPEKRIVRKAVCDYRNLKYPQMERRPRKVRPKTACEIKHAHMACRVVDHRCRKICMPGCRGARLPPSCVYVKPPTKCKKICCPYPSFSECKRPKPKKLRQQECNCVRVHMMCEAYALLRHRMTIKGGFTPL